MMTYRSLPLFLLAAGLSAQPVFDLWVGSLAVEGPGPTIYAVSAEYPATSGLFRSTDDGRNWMPLYVTEAGLPQPLIRSLAVDPTNPAIVFIATDPAHGGIWRSADAGVTWTPANTGLPDTDNDVQSLFIVRSAPYRMYAQTAAGVYRSMDAGRTWARQGALPAAASLFSINAGNSSHMYMATEPGAIYHSGDEGVSWQYMSAFTLKYRNSTDWIVDLTASPVIPNLLYAAVIGPWDWLNTGSGPQYIEGIHSSSDFGATWTNISHGIQPHYVYPDPGGRSILYYTQSGLAKVCKTPSLPPQSWNCVWVAGSGTMRLWIQPSTPDTMYGAAMNGVFKSTNGGLSWQYLDGAVRPTLAKPADSLNFTLVAGTQGHRTLDVQAVEKRNWVLPFTASTAETWLSLSASSGTTPGTLQLRVDAGGLAEGSYQGTLRLSSPQSANPSVTVPVRLTVIPAAARGPAYDLTGFAGTGKSGFSGDNGLAGAAELSEAAGVAVESSGAVYIADSGNHRIRKVSPDGIIRTIAGTGEPGFAGDGGPASAAQLRRPQALSAAGGTLYISDTSNARLRAVDAAAAINTLLSPLTDVGIRAPRGTAVDQAGNVYVSDSINNEIVKLAPSGMAREVTYFLKSPSDVAVDSSGMLYVADTGNHRIVKVDPEGNKTTVAGTGREGFDGDGGPATTAALSNPEGVAVDAAGQIYIADTGNHRIRVVSPQGNIRTIAGTGTAGAAGGGGPAAGAQLNAPTDVAVDTAGALYIADKGNSRVVKLTLQTGSGPRISTGGIVNAASYTAETAPGGLFSIFGAELASGAAQSGNAPWPSTLAGASVLVNGRPAPLYYAGPNQLNAQVPYETPTGSVPVIVSNGESYTSPAFMTVNAAAPAIFQTTPGRAVAQHDDGTLNGPGNPAAAGSVVVVYLTGQGLLDRPIATGAAASFDTLSRPVLPVAATVGGHPAEILFLGMTPGLVGLAQANVRIPPLAEGEYPLVITVGATPSRPALIAIRP